MSEDQRTPKRSLGKEGEEAWQALRTHAEWYGTNFWVAFGFALSPRPVHELERRMAEELERRGLRQRILVPDTPRVLRELLPVVLSDPKNCVWVEAIRLDPKGAKKRPWEEALLWFAQRANEHREVLRRSVPGGLVIAAHCELKARLRDALPDLWSIHSLILEFEGVDFELHRLPYEIAVPARRPDTRRVTKDIDLLGADIGRLQRSQQDTRQEEAAAELSLAHALLDKGRIAKAHEHALRALELSAETSPVRSAALGALARAEVALGSLAPARTHLTQALAQGIHKDELKAELLELRAFVAHQQGDLDAALHDYEGALEIEQSAGRLSRVADVLDGLGRVMWARGDSLGAQKRLSSSVGIQRQLAQEGSDAVVREKLRFSLETLANVQRAAGHLLEAEQSYVESLYLGRSLATEHPDAAQFLRRVITLTRLASLRSVMGRTSEAKAAIREAVNVLRRIQDWQGDPDDPATEERALRSVASNLRLEGAELEADDLEAEANALAQRHIDKS